MNREQMIEKAARALQEYYEPDHPSFGGYLPDAQLVVEAILPQVSTVAEVEALPDGSLLIDADDCAWTKGPADILWHFLVDTAGPLTVVWTPELVTS